MLKRIMNFGLLSIFSLSTLSTISAFQPSNLEKMHIDMDEFKIEDMGDNFYIHVGENVWLITNSVHKDSTGLFTYECNLKRSTDYKFEYEKKWKCPYCYRYWPLGKSCGNPDCPSKYKEFNN